MLVVRLSSIFIFLLGSYVVSGKCNKPNASAYQFEEELRKFYEIASHNWTLYDGGDILKWNCTDETENITKSSQEQAETNVNAVTAEDSPVEDGIFVTRSSGNRSHLNTFALVYRNIFSPRNDESYAPSSNIPVQITANISSEGNKTKTAFDVERPGFISDVDGHGSGLNTTRNKKELSEQTDTGEVSLGQHQNGSSHSSYNTPVNILLGEKHGITILNATYPDNSIILNYTDIDAFGVDYKYTDSTIVFAGKGQIRSTGMPSVVVAARVDGPVRLAVDWVHDRIYWLSDKYQTVEAANLDGSNRTLLTDVISGIEFPNNIAVDPYQKLLFFAANNTVYRVGLDRTNLERMKPDVNTTITVRCLTLDLRSKRLFFSGKLADNSRTPYIASSNYYGGEVKFYSIGNTDWNDVYSIDVFRDVLYFAHYKPGVTDSVWLFNTSWTGKRPVNVYNAPETRGGIWSIKVYHSGVQKQSDKLEG